MRRKAQKKQGAVGEWQPVSHYGLYCPQEGRTSDSVWDGKLLEGSDKTVTWLLLVLIFPVIQTVIGQRLQGSIDRNRGHQHAVRINTRIIWPRRGVKWLGSAHCERRADRICWQRSKKTLKNDSQVLSLDTQKNANASY